MRTKNNFFKTIQGYEEKILARHLYRISIHAKLLKTIKSKLPISLSSHVLDCVTTERKILLYTDSAIWSSQLRFYHQTILRAIVSANQGNFDTVQIKIIPKIIQLDKTEKPTLPSAENINFIFSQAENQEDENLKSALLNLASTLKNSKKMR